jgi:hypothetical protein
MVPYIFIGISAVIGLIFWGTKGLILGIIIGYIVSVIVGLALFPLMRLFNLGLIKKKYRLAVAEDFYSKNKNDILNLRRFQGMNEKEIIKMFSKYINEIQDEAIKLKNPIKKSPLDLNYAGYRPNFVEGGKNWVQKNFKEEKEIESMQRYVDFCGKAIYENFYKYS